jgi:hypothetical protein
MFRVVATLSLLSAVLCADAAPLVPNSAAPMVPIFGTGGSTPPPPTCSNEMDFSQACNSMYIGAL